MVAFPTITKSLGHHIFKKPFFSSHFQAIRTLILQSESSSVKLNNLTDLHSGIVEVILDRPEAKNAIGKEMLRGLQNCFEDVYRDSSVNVMIICSSVPRVFCAGADLKERKMMTPYEVKDFVNSLRSTFSFLEGLHIPTIAVIEGAALGGGLEMALCCDLRICGNMLESIPKTHPFSDLVSAALSFLYVDYTLQHDSGEDAKMALPETGLAIIPGAGGTQRLPRLIGKSKAKELIYTGQKIYGRDALDIGLVNHCVPSGEAHLKALEVSRAISQKGPLAIKMAKHAIDQGLEVDLASGLDVEEDCYEKLLHSNDRLEGLAAFAEKREPMYKGE